MTKNKDQIDGLANLDRRRFSKSMVNDAAAAFGAYAMFAGANSKGEGDAGISYQPDSKFTGETKITPETALIAGGGAVVGLNAAGDIIDGINCGDRVDEGLTRRGLGKAAFAAIVTGAGYGAGNVHGHNKAREAVRRDKTTQPLDSAVARIEQQAENDRNKPADHRR